MGDGNHGGKGCVQFGHHSSNVVFGHMARSFLKDRGWTGGHKDRSLRTGKEGGGRKSYVGMRNVNRRKRSGGQGSGGSGPRQVKKDRLKILNKSIV